MSTTAEENVRLGELTAQKANAARGPKFTMSSAPTEITGGFPGGLKPVRASGQEAADQLIR